MYSDIFLSEDYKTKQSTRRKKYKWRKDGYGACHLNQDEDGKTNTTRLPNTQEIVDYLTLTISFYIRGNVSI
jgi:hypothetical protein